jgi:hypothetical protein
MSKEPTSPADSRIVAAVHKQVAARAKIADCNSSAVPGYERVTRLIEAQYELELAKSEIHKAIAEAASELLAKLLEDERPGAI